jgi:hypothetical protein
MRFVRNDDAIAHIEASQVVFVSPLGANLTFCEALVPARARARLGAVHRFDFRKRGEGETVFFDL